ncbi:TonB-dependent receptor [Sphingobacterium phlebotomi]|uniref:TonB-dependent receptor n=2 Tax=Sphingobacterium phlebotomi TaxID=2605433 RepID=A0A5D4HD57_9SPHI|nr:TonB-dependent receptor [Sphingobacterium phlebotomi]
MMIKLLKLTVITFVSSISILHAQTVIRGKVLDEETKEPLIGASVGIKGSAEGTLTDKNGNYTLNVTTPKKTNVVLTAKYIGFLLQEVAVNNQTEINFLLAKDSYQLEEVVAIGYATVERKDLTGSVSSVNEKQLKDIPVNSAAEALTGRLAGVQVTTSEGAPGSEVQIKVRGGGSITQNNDPLYIIDGVQVEDGLSSLSPQDIASVDVLKDASATSIYGARGANGVVIITTKGGKEMKTQVNYNNILGMKSLANKLDVMNPYDFVLYQYERSRGLTTTETAFETRYGTWDDITHYQQTPFIDWQERTFGNDAFMQTHNASIVGGTKATQYNLSVTSNNEDGIMLNSGFDRKLVNFRFDNRVSDKLRVGFNVRYTNQSILGAGTSDAGSTTYNMLRHTIKYMPLDIGGLAEDEIDEAYYEDTNTGNAIGIINPVALSNAQYRDRKMQIVNLNGYFNYSFNRMISFRSTLGVNYNRQSTKSFEDGITSRSRVLGARLPMAGVLDADRNNLNFSNVLTISPKMTSGHKLNILLGNEFYNIAYNTSEIQLKNFPEGITAEKALGQLHLGTMLTTPELYPLTYQSETRTLSFFNRTNYSYKDKYLATFSFRTDGSSRFAEGNRWGYFPSGSVAWRISQEDFLKDVSVISDLKIRASYGSSGNDRIPDYLFMNVYNASAKYALNEELIPGYAAPELANKNLVWETTVSKNLGLDLSLLDNRIQFTVDAYQNKVHDLLIRVPIPSTAGYTTQLQNIGRTANKGLEFQLAATPINNKNFSWNTNFNIAFNRNTIEKISNRQDHYFANSGFGISGQPADYIVQEGQPVGAMYGFVSDGFYTTDDFNYDAATSRYTLKQGVTDVSDVIGIAQPGWMRLKDLDGNHVIDENDKTVIGNANPKFTGGLNQQFAYKNFDMSVFVNFVVGNDVYNANKIEFTNAYSAYANSLDMVAGRWKTIDQQGNKIQQVETISGQQYVTGVAPEILSEVNKDASMWMPISGTGAWYPTSWAMEDGSFLRINNITLGYTLPSSITNRIKANRLRVYATVNNLAVFTNYSGYDPEANTRRSVPVTPGVDYAAYPRSKTFIFGLNLSL